MKIYTNVFPISELSDFARHFVTEEMLFFDIETTGLSSARNQIYCIGCGWRAGEEIRIKLYFAENAMDEPKILDAFYKRLSGFHTIVSFNGTTFDIPFIIKRTEIESMQDADLLKSFEPVRIPVNTKTSRISVDLYKEVQHMKRLLELPAYRQKCVEEFLGCAREDKFNGGQLIEIYEEYTVNPAPELLQLLLLHNYEDVKGMFSLVDILAYRQLVDGEFTVVDIIAEPENNHVFMDFVSDPSQQTKTTGLHSETMSAASGSINDSRNCSGFLNVKFTPKFPLPQSIHRITGDSMLALGKEASMVRFPIRRGELKHFFPDPENYYYLPDEDAAIHKSVGEFVDREHRKKATKKNCYIRKNCAYIEIPVKTENSCLKKDCSDKHTYLEITAGELPTAEQIHDFLQTYFKTFFKQTK